MAEDRAVGDAERLHPLFLFTGLGQSLRGVLGGYAGLGYVAATGNLRLAVLGAIALLALTAAGIVIYWMKFAFRVGDHEVRIDSGVFSRTHRSIPFDRIQDVDISQGPLARLLGVAEVKFETGGGGGKDEGVLPAISLERAGQIRELIRGRRSGVVDRPADLPAEDRPPVYAMSFRRVLLAGLFNFSLAIVAGLFGLTQTFGDVLGFDPLAPRFWRNLLAASAPLQQFALAHRFIVAAAGLGVLVLIGAATGMVRTVLREYRFRLDRTETGLRRRRGLLTLTDVTIPIRRAQAAIIASGPVRAAFGWRELRLQSLAGDQPGSGDHVVAPLASDAEVGPIIRELGWRPVPDEVPWRRVSRAYIWLRAIALSPLLLLFGLQAALLAAVPAVVPDAIPGQSVATANGLMLPALLIFAVLVLAILARWLDWLRTGYVLDGDRLLVRRGWWRRRLLILPTSKIQSIDLRTSALGRWFGIETLRFGVAGGSGFSAHLIPAIPTAAAGQLRKDLLSLAT